MSDTQRTWTEMDDLLSTSPTNIVTVQTVRDGFYTLYNRTGVFGSAYIVAPATGDRVHTFTGVGYNTLDYDDIWQVGESQGTTVGADGSITVNETGVYDISFAGKFEADLGSVKLALDVNGSLADTTVPASVSIIGTGAEFFTSSHSLVSLSAGDVVTFMATPIAGESTAENLTVYEARVMARKIA